MNTFTRPWLPLAFLSALACASCGEEGFTVQYAPDFARSGTKMSVFGVFRDGRMNAEAWDTVGPRLAGTLRGSPCEAAYGNALMTGAPRLADAIDDYTRANGVTDDLLDKFASSAKGDAILLLSINGRPPSFTNDAGAPPPPPPRAGRGMGRRGGMMGGSSPGGGGVDRGVFEVTASLYSVQLHRSVATIQMVYKGQSIEEAWQRFTTRMQKEWPASMCMDWRQEARPDVEQIHKLAEE